ncbi:DUF1538 domain-containing protein [Candidatus Gracilibacteria bacterium]|nr:DUF1538 domain-containing protein [Candidatus Gracilibacteria bacterium]
MTLIALRFLKYFRESLRDLLPILAVIAFFQVFIFQSVPDNFGLMLIGIFLVWLGLALFLLGLEYGIFPIGKELTDSFTSKKKYAAIMVFGFFIGFSTTIAEPALFIIAEQAAQISDGRIHADMLRYVVALSVGFAVVLGIWRILRGFPIHYMIITGYIAVVGITFFTPEEIIGLSYDLGGVTTSTITVPLLAAIGIGLASTIKGRNPAIDGFGIIALASLTPMFFVQIYGIIVYTFSDSLHLGVVTESTAQALSPMLLQLDYFISNFFRVIRDILPIIITICFIQYIVLKQNIPFSKLKFILGGIVFVILGLYTFVIGLEMGLVQIGQTIAYSLTQKESIFFIFVFAFLIGFSTTMAEPTLIAISNKASEISLGEIRSFILRLFVALGVGFGITLGAYRIIEGHSLHYYIIAGYTIVVILTYLSPKNIIAIAYDSGGVTTSTITVPLVTALGIGLASNIDGRSPLLDGFGLIAFASLFPIISVLIYGIYTEYNKTHNTKSPKNTRALGLKDILK